MSDNRYSVNCKGSTIVPSRRLPYGINRLTCFALTLGESDGRTTLKNPLTFRIRTGGSNPLRTSSEAAIPRVKDLPAA